MIRLIKTVDAHVGGQALRLVVEGLPRPLGRTLVERGEWLKRHADSFRRIVLLPPRGHLDLTAAMLTEPVSAQAHAGILFMDSAGYPPMSGHAVIAATTIALERGLFFSSELERDDARLVLDTPAGIVHVEARLARHGDARRVDEVAMINVPSFVHAASQEVKAGARRLRVDIAFGGAFYAIADTEATGIPLAPARLPDLRRLGADICSSLNLSARPVHPADAALSGIAGVVFTGAPQDPEAHLRNVTVSGAGSVDLSPGIAGTSAVMAVLDAMGLLPDGQRFVHEGLSGAVVRGRITGRTQVGETPALLTEVAASAWITGEHSFCTDDDDPFREGISI